MKEIEDGKWIRVEDGENHEVLRKMGLDGKGWYPGDVQWCLHCYRAYKTGDFKYLKGKIGAYCPYDDCDGGYYLDAFEWEWPKENHPEYPERPILGVCYPLY